MFTREVVSSWIFPIDITSFDFIGDSDELLLLSRYGNQEHYVVNIVSGLLRCLDLSMLQQGEAVRLTDMWGKDVQLQASSNAIAQVIGVAASDSIDDSDISNPGNDVQMTGKWKSGVDLQSVPSTSAMATVCVGQRGGSLAVVLNDEAGNARNIVLVEVELG